MQHNGRSPCGCVRPSGGPPLWADHWTPSRARGFLDKQLQGCIHASENAGRHAYAFVGGRSGASCHPESKSVEIRISKVCALSHPFLLMPPSNAHKQSLSAGQHFSASGAAHMMQPDLQQQQQRHARAAAAAPASELKTLIVVQQPLASKPRIRPGMLPSICQQVTPACCASQAVPCWQQQHTKRQAATCSGCVTAQLVTAGDIVSLLPLRCHCTQALQLEHLDEAQPSTEGPAVPDTPTPADLLG